MKMICKHCGAQNPDNIRICTHCGMPIGKRDGQDTVKTEEVEIKTSKNVMKKKSLLLVIVIPLAFFLFSCVDTFLNRRCRLCILIHTFPYFSTYHLTNEKESKMEKKSDNPEYTKIFKERGILKPMLFTIEESASFAKVNVDEDGLESIDCRDFSYNGDTGVISAMTETIYFNIKDMSQEEVQAVDAAFQKEFAKNANVENYRATGKVVGQYYWVKYDFSNMNDKNVLKTFEDLGILDSREEKSAVYDMTLTEKDLLAQGYVKK